MTKKMLTTLPFSGFYESLWSDMMDQQLEMDAEHLSEEYDVPNDEVKDILYHFADFTAMGVAICKRYVDEFENMLNEEYDLGITFKYESMSSPKEYNFTTDRIFVEMSLDDVKKLLKVVGWTALCKQAKADFTSRSGFISFYTNNPAEWGKVAGWDHNQIGCLLRAAVAEIDEWDMSIYYAVSDLYLGDHYKWEKVEWELEHFHDNEEDPLDIVIPVGASAETYVKKFDELNHLKG